MQGKVGLTKQSLLAAAVAAYVGALVAFVTFQIWRFQTGADASMCPTEAGDWDRWCAGGELLLALVFDFLWALYGWPFAFVLTAPCALALGRLAPRLELHLVEPSLARAVCFGRSIRLSGGAAPARSGCCPVRSICRCVDLSAGKIRKIPIMLPRPLALRRMSAFHS